MITALQRKILNRAIKTIESGADEFTCNAIYHRSRFDGTVEKQTAYDLRVAYSEFYDIPGIECDLFTMDAEDRRSIRLLMLEFFKEAMKHGDIDDSQS